MRTDLHENFSNNNIIIIFEHSAEYNSHSVLLSPNIPRKIYRHKCKSYTGSFWLHKTDLQ